VSKLLAIGTIRANDGDEDLRCVWAFRDGDDKGKGWRGGSIDGFAKMRGSVRQTQGLDPVGRAGSLSSEHAEDCEASFGFVFNGDCRRYFCVLSRYQLQGSSEVVIDLLLSQGWTFLCF
jgi:hypothetical protein